MHFVEGMQELLKLEAQEKQLKLLTEI